MKKDSKSLDPANYNTIHNHSSSQAALVVAVAAVAVVCLGLAWLIALELAEALGLANPRRAVAQFLIMVPLGLGLVILTGRGLAAFTAQVLEYRLEIKRLEIEHEKKRALVASRPIPQAPRLTQHDEAFVVLLRAVVLEAFEHGRYRLGEGRPWSRRGALAFKASPYSLEVTERQAGQVRAWLVEREVVRAGLDQLNLEQFQTFAHFERLLEAEYYIPIVTREDLRQ